MKNYSDIRNYFVKNGAKETLEALQMIDAHVPEVSEFGEDEAGDAKIEDMRFVKRHLDFYSSDGDNENGIDSFSSIQHIFELKIGAKFEIVLTSLENGDVEHSIKELRND